MSECDWHRLWPPEGERKCDNPPAVVRDGYGGSRNVRFCAGHDPLGGSMSEQPTPDDVRNAVFRGERSMLGDAYARVGADRTLQICVTFRGFIVPLEWSDYLTFVREAVRHQGPVAAHGGPR